MTKKLEETLDLPRLDEALRVLAEQEAELEEAKKPATTADDFKRALEKSLELESGMVSLPMLGSHDREMDEIADKSMQTFEDLKDLGFSVEAKHSGPIFESMVTMLRLSMDAKNHKLEKRFRLMKLQLDRERLDMQKRSMGEELIEAGDETVFLDRNNVLENLRTTKKS